MNSSENPGRSTAAQRQRENDNASENKVAIVTGAGGGFGEGIAPRFAAEGAKIAVVDLRGDVAARVSGRWAMARSPSPRTWARPRMSRASSAPRRRPLARRISWSTTGDAPDRPILQVDEAAFDRIFRVNVKSIFHFVREMAPWKIRVNAICRVMGETGMLEAFMGVPDTPENRARFIATIPLGRISRPDDIASVTHYLASDAAAFITSVDCRLMAAGPCDGDPPRRRPARRAGRKPDLVPGGAGAVLG